MAHASEILKALMEENEKSRMHLKSLKQLSGQVYSDYKDAQVNNNTTKSFFHQNRRVSHNLPNPQANVMMTGQDSPAKSSFYKISDRRSSESKYHKFIGPNNANPQEHQKKKSERIIRIKVNTNCLQLYKSGRDSKHRARNRDNFKQ